MVNIDSEDARWDADLCERIRGWSQDRSNDGGAHHHEFPLREHLLRCDQPKLAEQHLDHWHLQCHTFVAVIMS